jgi:glycosyltransferase involved in cell wall biosynthesis
MKVSVQVITYNHEKYIAQAIESVLMQEVNFDYEIVIGEDCSTDKTREIVLAYQEKHPDKIRALLRERNLGGMKNVVETFNACRGEYIAALEGDDYWTSPHKLQKQVDYLDQHPECALCFHNVTRFYQDGSREPHTYNAPDQKEICTLDDLWVKNFITTCSAMLRKKCVEPLPAWFVTLPWGDWTLFILAARRGPIGYLKEVMGAHRIHSGGMWSSLDRIERLELLFRFYTAIDAYLEFAYHNAIRVQVAKQCFYLAEEYEKNKDLTNARKYALKYLRESNSESKALGQDPWRLLVRVYAPKSYKLIAGVRKRLSQMRA